MWKEGNARIHIVLAVRPGLAKIIEQVHIPKDFESSETDCHIAENACCSDYGDTLSSKEVHLLSKSQSLRWDTTYYGFEDRLDINTGVAWVSLPIARIHPRVAPEFKIHSWPATHHNPGWMDHCQVWHRSSDAIPILDPADVEEAYSSLSNWSRFLGRLWFRFHPKLDHGNGSYHIKIRAHWKLAGFTTKNPAFQHHNFGFN